MVDDDSVGAEPWPQRGDHVVDDRIILEHEVNAGRAANGVGGSGGNANAELLERACLVGRAVPDGHFVATLGGGFSKGAPEEAGSEICDVCHLLKASRRRRR